MLALLMAATIGVSPAPHPAADAWKAFVSNPSRETYARLAAKFRTCTTNACVTSLAPDSSNTGKLVALLDRGDIRAVDLSFRAYKGLDGGDLEDVARALGQLADRNGELFLTEAKAAGLSPTELGGIVSMLPESTIDNEPERRRAIQRRASSLSKVKRPDLAGYRAAAIEALRAYQ